jgi:hypothetical protein
MPDAVRPLTSTGHTVAAYEEDIVKKTPRDSPLISYICQLKSFEYKQGVMNLSRQQNSRMRCKNLHEHSTNTENASKAQGQSHPPVISKISGCKGAEETFG